MKCDVVDSQRRRQLTTTVMNDDDLNFDRDFDHIHGA